MTYRIDPKTRRIIVSDLTPEHKNKASGVHGVGDGTVVGSNEFDDYIREQEEKDEINGLLSSYNASMANEKHSSNRRGFEIR